MVLVAATTGVEGLVGRCMENFGWKVLRHRHPDDLPDRFAKTFPGVLEAGGPARSSSFGRKV